LKKIDDFLKKNWGHFKDKWQSIYNDNHNRIYNDGVRRGLQKGIDIFKINNISIDELLGRCSMDGFDKFYC